MADRVQASGGGSVLAGRPEQVPRRSLPGHQKMKRALGFLDTGPWSREASFAGHLQAWNAFGVVEASQLIASQGTNSGMQLVLKHDLFALAPAKKFVLWREWSSPR